MYYVINFSLLHSRACASHESNYDAPTVSHVTFIILCHADVHVEFLLTIFRYQILIFSQHIFINLQHFDSCLQFIGRDEAEFTSNQIC